MEECLECSSRTWQNVDSMLGCVWVMQPWDLFGVECWDHIGLMLSRYYFRVCVGLYLRLGHFSVVEFWSIIDTKKHMSMVCLTRSFLSFWTCCT